MTGRVTLHLQMARQCVCSTCAPHAACRVAISLLYHQSVYLCPNQSDGIHQLFSGSDYQSLLITSLLIGLINFQPFSDCGRAALVVVFACPSTTD